MKARWYDPAIGRFISPDTIIPDPTNPQSFNRYSYVFNRPLVLTDPSGHMPSDGCEYEGCTLANGLNPESTWQAPDGTQTPWDPIAAGAQDYNPITEAVIPGTVGLFGVAALPTAVGYFAGEVAWPALVRGGQAIASWLCLDGDCTNEAIRLYRAVSNTEFQQLMETGEFQSVVQSAEGKYFATTIENAGIWGEKMMGTGNFRIIQVDVSAEAASKFMNWNNLDGIGTAYYATLEQLENAYWNIVGVTQ